MFLYTGKNRPELYLDAGFRSYSSNFREKASEKFPRGLTNNRVFFFSTSGHLNFGIDTGVGPHNTG